MAFSVVGVMAVSGVAGANSFVWPTHQTGDVAIIVHTARMNDVAVTVTSGTVDTLLSAVESTNTTGTRRRLTVAIRTAASGSEGNVAFSDAGQMNVISGIVVRGVTAPTAWLANTHGTDPGGSTDVTVPCGSPASGSVVIGLVASAEGTLDNITPPWVNADLTSVTERENGQYAGGAGASIFILSGEGAPGGAIDPFTVVQTTSARWSAGSLELVVSGSTPDPTITDVDTDETVLAGQTSVAVTGTDLGTTNADRVFDLVQGSTVVPQTETGTGTSTAATLTIVIEQTGADIKFGAANLRITRDSDSADGELAVTVNPPSGHLYVDVGTPATDGDDRITASPDIASGDQIEARGEGGGSVPTGLNLYDDATFDFDVGETPAAFDVRVWDASDSTWGAWATQTISGGDVTATGAATAPAATASGTGTIQIAASGAVTAASATAAGTGAVGIPASGAATAPAATAAGTGAITHTSSGAASAPAATASGAGTITVTSSGAATAPSAEASGSGSVAGVESGSGAVVAPKATASGSGTVAMASTAVTFAPVAVASGSGTIIIVGSGACIAPSARASGYDVPPVASGGRGMWGRLRLGLGLGL
jgi:hypothetical protein